MQRTFVVIALALAMTCAFAGITATDYVKAPAAVPADGNYTTTTYTTIGLVTATTGNIYLGAWKNTTALGNSTGWSGYLQQLAAKTLSSSANSTWTFTGPQAGIAFYNGYIFSLTVEQDTTSKIANIIVYSQLLTGSAALPRLVVSTNTNTAFVPLPLGMASNGKTIYVIYSAADKKVNLTSFTLGGSVSTTEYTILTVNPTGFSAVWGEALSATQVYCVWKEDTTYKAGVLDLSKGTLTGTAITGTYTGTTCLGYSTDKKIYGALCIFASSNTVVNGTEVTTYNNYTYGVTFGHNSSYAVVNITSYVNVTDTIIPDFFPYAQYLAVIYNYYGAKTYSYEIWNLETGLPFKNETKFAVLTDTTALTYLRVPAGGVYTLNYDTPCTTTNGTTTCTRSNIQVGLVLSGSYLTTIFGFLCTIVAGLFLF